MADDIKSREAKLMNNPDQTMTDICAHVASGGTLTELCETWGVRYGVIASWVREDRPRNTRLTDAMNDRSEWFREKIYSEFKRIGTSDIRKIYDKKGNILPVHEWPDDVASFVSSVEQEELFEGKGKDREQIGNVKKIKLWNKERALELIGKNIHMFVEQHTHSGKITLEELVNASREDEDGEQGDQG